MIKANHHPASRSLVVARRTSAIGTDVCDSEAPKGGAAVTIGDKADQRHVSTVFHSAWTLVTG